VSNLEQRRAVGQSLGLRPLPPPSASSPEVPLPGWGRARPDGAFSPPCSATAMANLPSRRTATPLENRDRSGTSTTRPPSPSARHSLVRRPHGELALTLGGTAADNVGVTQVMWRTVGWHRDGEWDDETGRPAGCHSAWDERPDGHARDAAGNTATASLMSPEQHRAADGGDYRADRGGNGGGPGHRVSQRLSQRGGSPV